MCCWSGTDTWLIHGALGQIKKQRAICETTGSAASLSPWTIIWILQRTRNDLFHPSQQRGKLGPNLFMLTNPGSWIEGLFWLMLLFQTALLGLSVWCLEDSSRTNIYPGPKEMMLLIRDVRFNQRVLLLLRSKKGVRACVCMRVQANKRLINTYSSHWFPVAA